MVSSLAQDPLTSHPDLADEDRSWLQRLVGDWQLVADLALADLVLWCPVPRRETAGGFVAMAQVRPFTAPTLFHRDIVGSRARADLRALVERIWSGGERPEGTGPEVAAGGTLQVRLWPVARGGRVIAVVSAHADPNGRPARSVIEKNYSRTAASLLDMMQHGRWPAPEEPTDVWVGGTPRVGDGLVVIGPDSVAEFTSPNAVSALRRFGITTTLEGRRLTDVLAGTDAARRPNDEGTWAVLTGLRAGRREVQSGGASLTVRSVPLVGPSGWQGALLLVRDVTELRRQEQRLLTKDATIREIHHRIKNNLQTVAALLRMQSRRLTSEEGKEALRDATRRVSSIAVVHDTLSRNLDEDVAFDEVCDRILRMVGDLASSDGYVDAKREGSFGVVAPDTATSLAMIITELCQNAIEHGLGSGSGKVRVAPSRKDGTLRVDILDDGVGLPDDFVLGQQTSLGLAIISTLVADLGGSVSIAARDDGQQGTCARVELPTSR